MTSSLFSLGSAIGAIINTFQTGWLFNKLISHNVSIPLITSLTGVCGGVFTLPTSPIAIGIVVVSDLTQPDYGPHRLALLPHGVRVRRAHRARHHVGRCGPRG